MYLFGLNNGAVFEGSLSGTGIFNYASAAVIVGAGVFLGTVLQGSYTAKFAERLGPLNFQDGVVLLIVQLVLFYAFTKVNLPLSITQSFVGGWAALLVLQGYRELVSLNWLVLWWILSPFIALAGTAVLYKALRRASYRAKISTVSYLVRVFALLSVFYTSFVLGANNVGFIAGVFNLNILEIFLLAVAAALGALAASGMSKAVGEDLIVVGALGIVSAIVGGSTVLLGLTYLGLPASLTTVTLGAIIGVGVSSKPRTFNTRYLIMVLLSWVLAFLLGFAVTYALDLVVRLLS